MCWRGKQWLCGALAVCITVGACGKRRPVDAPAKLESSHHVQDAELSVLAHVTPLAQKHDATRPWVEIGVQAVVFGSHRETLVAGRTPALSWLGGDGASLAPQHDLWVRVHALAPVRAWVAVLDAWSHRHPGAAAGGRVHLAARDARTPTTLGEWSFEYADAISSDCHDEWYPAGEWDDWMHHWAHVYETCMQQSRECAPPSAKASPQLSADLKGGTLQITIAQRDGGTQLRFTQYDRPRYKVVRHQQIDMSDDREALRIREERVALPPSAGKHERGAEALFTFRTAELVRWAGAPALLAPWCERQSCRVRVVAASTAAAGEVLVALNSLTPRGAGYKFCFE